VDDVVHPPPAASPFAAAARLILGWHYLPLLVLGVLWEIVSASGTLPANTLPALHLVIARAIHFFTSGDILPHLIRSLERAAVGFLVAVVIGIATGAAMARSSVVQGLAAPLLALTNSIPKPAFYPLFLIWLGAGTWSDTAVIFTGCVIPVIISTYNGARRVSPNVIWMAQNLGMRRARLMLRVILPAALPEVLVGLRIALTLAWVMLVSAEMLAGQDGLGFLIGFVGEAGDYEGMFAVVLIIALIGFIADRAFQRFIKRCLIPYRG
jgi:NitT/TauT family transport system permease protein